MHERCILIHTFKLKVVNQCLLLGLSNLELLRRTSCWCCNVLIDLLVIIGYLLGLSLSIWGSHDRPAVEVLGFLLLLKSKRFKVVYANSLMQQSTFESG